MEKKFFGNWYVASRVDFWSFLLKKWIFDFFTKIDIWPQCRFYVIFSQNMKFQFFTKKLLYGPESEGRFYVIFAPKDEILILRPKIDLWTRGSILYKNCSKSEISIFWPKIDMLLRGFILCHFFSKRWNFNFLTKTWFATLRRNFM